MFGLFMLFGIVKKNGILQVDYTNVLRRRGMPAGEAILEANHTRLRPILMTTVMLIAAMIPIALGRGPGAARRASLAKVDPRRPDPLAVADAAGHAGGLLALGRPELLRGTPAWLLPPPGGTGVIQGRVGRAVRRRGVGRSRLRRQTINRTTNGRD